MFFSRRSAFRLRHSAADTHKEAIAVKAEQERLATYRDRLAKVRRKLADKTIRSSVRDIIRADRERSP